MRKANPLGVNIDYDGGFIPSWGKVVRLTHCAELRGIVQTTVTVVAELDEDFGNTFWAVSETQGSFAQLLYTGDSADAADAAASRFVELHSARMDRLSRNGSVQIDMVAPARTSRYEI